MPRNSESTWKSPSARRTYNFPQSRVTDHRIGLTLYKLDEMMNGGCDEVFEALRLADQTAKLLRQDNERK